MFTIIPGDFHVPINDISSLESPPFLLVSLFAHFLLLQAMLWLTLGFRMAEDAPVHDLLSSCPMVHSLVPSWPLPFYFPASP